MKNTKLWRTISLIVLGIYISIPLWITAFMAMTDNLYMNLFGTEEPLTFFEGLILVVYGWFMYTGLIFLCLVLCTGLAALIMNAIRKKKNSMQK